MGVIRHANNGSCPKCLLILDRYPGLYEPLRDWFIGLQQKHPEAHVSCAGRGYEEQETLFQGRRSRAHYGESAHNFNAALDIFENGNDPKNIYELEWYIDVLRPNLPDWMIWYGNPEYRHVFFELPHAEIRHWKRMRDSGQLLLVEPFPEEDV